MGRHHLPRTGHTGLGGTGSPAQGVVRVSFRAPRGGIIFQEPGTLAGGGRGVQPRGWSEFPSGPLGRHHLPRTGHTGLGGTGSPAQGVVGVSFRAPTEPSSCKNRAHRPRGDGKSSPGGGRSILEGPWSGIIFQEPGTLAWGGRGVQPMGWSEYVSGPLGRHHFPKTGTPAWGGAGSPAQGVVGVSFRAYGEASSSKNRAHRPGGDGESSPGGGWSILQGPWGGIIFQETGTRPGEDGESSAGGGRSILHGPWGGIIFQEPGTPARGGRGV